MASKHAADAEGNFQAYNVTPDFCKIGKRVIAFDIQQVLAQEKSDYSSNVRARGCKVLYVGSVIKGVQGNAGSGIGSSVSQDAGDSRVLTGSSNLFVNGNPAARHGDEVTMNISSADNGTLGLLQTMCKAPTPPFHLARRNSSPGTEKRTNPRSRSTSKRSTMASRWSASLVAACLKRRKWKPEECG